MYEYFSPILIFKILTIFYYVFKSINPDKLFWLIDYTKFYEFESSYID
jgi:hypothetical protein